MSDLPGVVAFAFTFTFTMTAVAAAAATSSLCVRVGSGSDGSNVIVGRGAGSYRHCSGARRELGLMKLWPNARDKFVLVKIVSVITSYLLTKTIVLRRSMVLWRQAETSRNRSCMTSRHPIQTSGISGLCCIVQFSTIRST
jgi:hypothetical protein